MATRHNQMRLPRQWSPRVVPTWPVEIDWQHELASGLQFYFLPGIRFDDVTRLTPPVALASSAPALGALGAGLTSNGGYAATASSLSAGNGANLCGDVSFFWCGSMTYAGGNCGLLAKGINNFGQPFDFFAQQTSTSTAQILFVKGYNGQATIYITPVFSINYGSPISFCATSPAANTSASGYVNGASVSLPLQAGTTVGVVPQNSNSPFYIGSRPDGATSLYGNVFTCSAYNRVISSTEAEWLNAEPFAMLRPVLRRNYYVPGLSPFYSSGNFFFAS